MKTKIIAAAIIAALSIPIAQAEKYFEIDSLGQAEKPKKGLKIATTKQFTIWFELDSAQRTSDESGTAWMLWNYEKKPTQIAGKNVRSMRRLVLADCKLRMIKSMHITTFADQYGQGEIIHNVDVSQDDKFEPVKSGKTAEIQLNTICESLGISGSKVQ